MDREGEGNDRDDLERTKLVAEIREIETRTRETQQRIASGWTNSWRDHLRAGSAFLGVLVTLVIGTPTALYQFYQYRQQLQAEHRFEVSATMASLIGKLTSKTTETEEKRGAAIGLSLMGSAALPILIESLDIVRAEPVSETIIEGLEDVLRRQKGDPDVVLEPVRRATDRSVSRASADPHPDNYLSAARHISALARLITAAKTATPALKKQLVLRDDLNRTLLKIDTMMDGVPDAYEETVGQNVELLKTAVKDFANSPADGLRSFAFTR